MMKYLEDYPIYLESSVKFDFHLRYQPVRPGAEFTQIEFGADTQVLYDCERFAMVHYSDYFANSRAKGSKIGGSNVKTPERINILPDKLVPLVVNMPTGNSDKLQMIQMSTLGLTLSSTVILVVMIYSKSKDNIKEMSTF